MQASLMFVVDVMTALGAMAFLLGAAVLGLIIVAIRKRN